MWIHIGRWGLSPALTHVYSESGVGLTYLWLARWCCTDATSWVSETLQWSGLNSISSAKLNPWYSMNHILCSVLIRIMATFAVIWIMSRCQCIVEHKIFFSLNEIKYYKHNVFWEDKTRFTMRSFSNSMINAEYLFSKLSLFFSQYIYVYM